MNSKRIFLILFIIFVIIFVGYTIYRTSNFSKEILRLEILGPETAKMGEEIEYTIKYKNNGNFVLENVKLIFDMPENSLTEDGKTRIIQKLEDIYPGSEESVKIKTRLLGKESDLKIAKASLSYVPKSLTASFESKTTFTTKIETVPITLDFDLPSKVEKGKELQYSVNYFSNIDYPLENLSLRIDPVEGFEFISSNPTSLDNYEWKLNNLNKTEGGRVTIKGKISAEANQNIKFSASLGIWKEGVFVIIKQSSFDVQVIQPLLYIYQQVNGSGSYIASPGETLNYRIFFKNIGSSPFENLFVVVKLESQALDMSSILAPEGQVQPNDNMIIWSWQQSRQLSYLDVQEEGSVEFSVKVKENLDTLNTDINNILISSLVNISQITQKFDIKVNSGLIISQNAQYKSSDIQNSGPIPPKVGEETTYTINWNIKNYFSNTKNVKVKAVLPENVSLTGKIMPTYEFSNFFFDSQSREIIWLAGDILAGTGVKGDPITLSFQVSLIPKSNQKGKTADLIGTATITGENEFTGTTISATAQSIDTSIPYDFVNSGKGVVQ